MCLFIHFTGAVAVGRGWPWPAALLLRDPPHTDRIFSSTCSKHLPKLIPPHPNPTLPPRSKQGLTCQRMTGKKKYQPGEGISNCQDRLKGTHKPLLRQGYQTSREAEVGDCLRERSGVPPGFLHALPTILGCYSELTLLQPSHLTGGKRKSVSPPSFKHRGAQNVHMRCKERVGGKVQQAVSGPAPRVLRQEHPPSFHPSANSLSTHHVLSLCMQQ